MGHTYEPDDADERNAPRRYDELSETENRNAVFNLKQYAQLMLRVYERIKHDPKAYQEFLELTDGLTRRSTASSEQESTQQRFEF